MPMLLSVLSIGSTIICEDKEGSVPVKVKTCVERRGTWVGSWGCELPWGRKEGVWAGKRAKFNIRELPQGTNSKYTPLSRIGNNKHNTSRRNFIASFDIYDEIDATEDGLLICRHHLQTRQAWETGYRTLGVS